MFSFHPRFPILFGSEADGNVTLRLVFSRTDNRSSSAPHQGIAPTLPSTLALEAGAQPCRSEPLLISLSQLCFFVHAQRDRRSCGDVYIMLTHTYAAGATLLSTHVKKAPASMTPDLTNVAA